MFSEARFPSLKICSVKMHKAIVLFLDPALAACDTACWEVQQRRIGKRPETEGVCPGPARPYLATQQFLYLPKIYNKPLWTPFLDASTL